MNIIQLFLVAAVSTMLIAPAFGAISDKTGLKKEFTIETSGQDFVVETVANFDIANVTFNQDDKKLTFDIDSLLEENLGEIQIPINLIDGNLTTSINGQEIHPQIRKNDKISFIVLEFNGTGNNSLEIVGTTYLPEFSGLASLVMGASFATFFLSKKFRKI